MFLQRLKRALGRKILRLGPRVHALIAVLVLVLIAVDLATVQSFKRISGNVYDTLITLRPIKGKVDPEIVILDIDEGSLAALGKTYGRWPWPNHVFGEMVERLHAQGAKAIVFDVIFSDADRLRPDSDAAFNRTIDRVGSKMPIFFPMVRLDPANDAKSQIPTEALPGARKIAAAPSINSTIAVLLPQVPSALDQGRLGFLNIYPDKDGITRRYPTRLEHAGWQFDSYGAKISRDLTEKSVAEAEFLLNWKGGAFTYPYVSAKDIFSDGKLGSNSPPNLSGKIVLIGSSAPALQDLKATPVGSPFPGLEILATAIDNLKNGDGIQSASSTVTTVIALGFIGLLTYLFSKTLKPDQINLLFLIAQAILIALAWVLLSFRNFYLNLSGAIAYGTAFFAIAKIASLQIAPLGREAIFEIFQQSPSTRVIIHAFLTKNLSAKQLRHLHERVIGRGAAIKGSMIAPVLETDEDAGIFTDQFHQALVFLQFTPGESGSEPNPEDQAMAQDMIHRELDRVSARAKVVRSEMFAIDTTAIPTIGGTMVGPALYAIGLQRVLSGDPR